MKHMFDVEIAAEFGVNEALLLENIAFWVNKNKSENRNYHNGVYWTYNSIAAFKEMFPYLSTKKIRTAMENLRINNLVATANFNSDSRNHTLWYTLTERSQKYFNKTKKNYIKSFNNNPNTQLQKNPLHYINPDMDYEKIFEKLTS